VFCTIRCGCGKTSLVAVKREFLEQRNIQPTKKSDPRLVTDGRDARACNGGIGPMVRHGLTVPCPTAENLPANRGEFTCGCRARECRTPQGRSRPRLCGVEGDLSETSANDRRDTSAAGAAADRQPRGETRPPASSTLAAVIRTNPDFAGAGNNHPFTMTEKPAVLSTKSFTPQVPLYH